MDVMCFGVEYVQDKFHKKRKFPSGDFGSEFAAANELPSATADMNPTSYFFSEMFFFDVFSTYS